MKIENRALIYEKYSELLDGIMVYQEQQVDLREMCLKILLGSFALVGGLLFVKVDISSQALLLMSALFPIFSLIIITVNLIIDLVYKERLKLAFVSEALRLEKAYEWLPKFQISLLASNRKNTLPASGQITYYFGCVGLLLLMSAISLGIDPIFSHIIDKIIIFVIYIAIYVSYFLFMSQIVKKTEAVLEMF